MPDRDPTGTQGVPVPVHMKGILPWLVRCTRHAVTRDFCPASAVLVGPVQNIFFSSPHTVFLHLTPSPSKLDRQSCSVAFLLICVSGKKSQFVDKKRNFKLSERQHIERQETAP
jgi:hypothetical protein